MKKRRLTGLVLGFGLAVAGSGCSESYKQPISRSPIELVKPTRGTPVGELENWTFEDGHLYRKRIQIGGKDYCPKSLKEARELEKSLKEEYDRRHEEILKKHGPYVIF